MPAAAPKQYDVALGLTTPYMEDLVGETRVRDAQWLMQGHTRFDGLAPYKDGIVDGVYGPLTGQATMRSKFWLGYPDAECDDRFGQTLYEYLLPPPAKPRKLPAAFQERRAARIKATQQSKGQLALARAIREIGYKETPVNHTKYGKWYGWDGVAWCAIFESWCFDQIGVKNYHYAACALIHADAVANRNGLYIVRDPRAGDIAIHRHNGDPFAHTSFFKEWIDGQRFHDVGGNTGPTNISNGGMVLEQERYRGNITAFVRAA